MPKKYSRGNNPNSHGNNSKIGTAKTITLPDRLWDLAKAIGNGNYSKGVRTMCEEKQELMNLLKRLCDYCEALTDQEDVLSEYSLNEIREEIKEIRRSLSPRQPSESIILSNPA